MSVEERVKQRSFVGHTDLSLYDIDDSLSIQYISTGI